MSDQLVTRSPASGGSSGGGSGGSSERGLLLRSTALSSPLATTFDDVYPFNSTPANSIGTLTTNTTNSTITIASDGWHRVRSVIKVGALTDGDFGWVKIQSGSTVLGQAAWHYGGQYDELSIIIDEPLYLTSGTVLKIVLNVFQSDFDAVDQVVGDGKASYFLVEKMYTTGESMEEEAP